MPQQTIAERIRAFDTNHIPVASPIERELRDIIAGLSSQLSTAASTLAGLADYAESATLENDPLPGDCTNAREFIAALPSFTAPPIPPKRKPVCRTCGGENVMADAYASWDFDTQTWELASIFDKGATCEDCEGECRIDMVEVQPTNG